LQAHQLLNGLARASFCPCLHPLSEQHECNEEGRNLEIEIMDFTNNSSMRNSVNGEVVDAIEKREEKKIRENRSQL
jgi:hypothetical protein